MKIILNGVTPIYNKKNYLLGIFFTYTKLENLGFISWNYLMTPKFKLMSFRSLAFYKPTPHIPSDLTYIVRFLLTEVIWVWILCYQMLWNFSSIDTLFLVFIFDYNMLQIWFHLFIETMMALWYSVSSFNLFI